MDKLERNPCNILVQPKPNNMRGDATDTQACALPSVRLNSKARIVSCKANRTAAEVHAPAELLERPGWLQLQRSP